jgi:hypothetical protein
LLQKERACLPSCFLPKEQCVTAGSALFWHSFFSKSPRPISHGNFIFQVYGFTTACFKILQDLMACPPCHSSNFMVLKLKPAVLYYEFLIDEKKPFVFYRNVCISLIVHKCILAIHSRFIGCLPLGKFIINILSSMVKPILPLILE